MQTEKLSWFPHVFGERIFFCLMANSLFSPSATQPSIRRERSPVQRHRGAARGEGQQAPSWARHRLIKMQLRGSSKNGTEKGHGPSEASFPRQHAIESERRES